MSLCGSRHHAAGHDSRHVTAPRPGDGRTWRVDSCLLPQDETMEVVRRVENRLARPASLPARPRCQAGASEVINRSRNSRRSTLPFALVGSASTNSGSASASWLAMCARQCSTARRSRSAPRPPPRRPPTRPTWDRGRRTRMPPSPRVQQQHVLDLAGVDVAATRDNHIALARDQVQVAVLEPADVPGVQPARA